LFLDEVDSVIEVPTLDEDEAALAVQAVMAELKRRDLHAVVAVADNHGELLALVRRNGANLSSVATATNKAYTAAREGQPSKTIGVGAREHGWDALYYGEAKYTGFGGGVPVVVGNRVLGAVGVSGLTEEEDENFATLGVNAILNSRRKT
jgi:glc operon protein GlcG